MDNPVVFGDINRFAIQVDKLSLSRELGDVQILICGERIGDGIDVYLPTFVSELRAYSRLHKKTYDWTKDFNGVSDEDAFALLKEVVESGVATDGISASAAFNYHLVHSLDCEIDGWVIFIIDDGCDKRIIWEEDNARSRPAHDRKQLRSTKLPGTEFVQIVEEFVQLMIQKSVPSITTL